MPQDALTYRYVVDDVDSLSEIHLTDGGNPEVLTESFNHDADGNMTTRTDNMSGEIITYEWNDFDKLVKAGSVLSGVPTTTAKGNDTGAVVKSVEYSEYGDLINSSGSGTNSPKTWVGGLSVKDDTADAGLYLMGHRHYSNVLGRFIGRDPIRFSGDLNLDNYSTKPVTFVDPSGLDPEPPPFEGIEAFESVPFTFHHPRLYNVFAIEGRGRCNCPPNSKPQNEGQFEPAPGSQQTSTPFRRTVF